MGFFKNRFIEVRNGTKITYSESDLRKLDRTYEKEVLPVNNGRVKSPLRKVSQQAYLSQVRDYAFEQLLDKHLYTFRHILVIPNPYDVVRQSAILLFNTPTKVKLKYRVIGDSEGTDFTAETEYTTRHRAAVLGLYEGRNNQVELELIDEDGQVVKRRMLQIYVPESAAKQEEKAHLRKADKESSRFPFLMFSGAAFHPFAADADGKIRYTTRLKTTNTGMFPLANGHFLYIDRTANRMTETGRIKSCCYHEMDYMGRVFRTYLLDYPIHRILAQRGNQLYLRMIVSTEGEDEEQGDREEGKQLVILDLATGSVEETSVPPQREEAMGGQEVDAIDVAAGSQKMISRIKENVIYSSDRKWKLSYLKEKSHQDGKVRLIESECATGRVTVRRHLSLDVSKIWLFEPDILSLSRPMERKEEVVLGTIAPPKPWEGTLPPETEESIDKDYFGGARMCGELFLCNILPGRVARIYLVGKEHAYVQDYEKIRVIDRKKLPFVISLAQLAADEYQIYIESQEVVHRLKNEIRVADR